VSHFGVKVLSGGRTGHRQQIRYGEDAIGKSHHRGKISAAAVDELKEPGWTVLTWDQLDGKLTTHLESADALIVRSAVQADAALLQHAKKLRVIGRAGVGVDNIDLDAATHKGIAVMNTQARMPCRGGADLGMMLRWPAISAC